MLPDVFSWPQFTHLVERVDCRHALPIDPITSTRRADGVGVYSDPCVEGWIVIVGISGFDDQAI